MGHMLTMIHLANRLTTARDEAQASLGAKYSEKIVPYKDVIVRYMAASGKDILDATLKLAKTSMDYHKDPLLILAAGVELAQGGIDAA